MFRNLSWGLIFASFYAAIDHMKQSFIISLKAFFFFDLLNDTKHYFYFWYVKKRKKREAAYI